MVKFNDVDEFNGHRLTWIFCRWMANISALAFIVLIPMAWFTEIIRWFHPVIAMGVIMFFDGCGKQSMKDATVILDRFDKEGEVE